MRALTVDSIDFENGVITIDKAVKENDELGKPKTANPDTFRLNRKLLNS
jgi:hypothetical protein